LAIGVERTRPTHLARRAPVIDVTPDCARNDNTPWALTALRLIPLPVHAALRMTTGLLTMAAPFLAGFDTPATLLAIVIGAIVVGVALTATPDERGLTPLPADAVHAADWTTVFALLGAATFVAAEGDDRAGGVLVAIALLQLAGNLTTRYSLRDG
jgi:hypothetical protein